MFVCQKLRYKRVRVSAVPNDLEPISHWHPSLGKYAVSGTQAALSQVLAACRAACVACETECAKHGAHMNHCATCAECCRRCADACAKLIGGASA